MTPYQAYWAGRLNAYSAFYKGPVREDVDYRGGRASWPHWLSRYAMWLDYQIWVKEIWSHQFGVEQDPGRVTDFFRAMRPYLYDRYEPATASTFPVIVQQFHRGQWLPVTVKRKFVRLKPFGESFELFQRMLDGLPVKV